VLRFGADGSFLNVVAKKGEGPGDLRQRPTMIGMDAGSLRYFEGSRGTLTWIAPDGTLLRTEDTGLPRDRFLPSSVSVRGTFENGDYLVAVFEPGPRDGSTLRPEARRHFVRAGPGGGALDTLYSHEMSGGSLVLDGGLTLVSYPGPSDGPLVFYFAERERMLRVDRPWPGSDGVTRVALQWMDGRGAPTQRRELVIDPVPFAGEARDSARARVFNSVMFRRKTLSRELERQLNALTAWPDHYPAFETAMLRDDGTIWLKTPEARRGQPTHWLVVDSLFTPVARAYLPAGTAPLLWDGPDAWTSLTSPSGEPFIARLRQRAAPITPS
jgi:hypothetical protein